VAFEVRLLGFGLIGGVNFTVVSGASCGGAALTPAAPMAAAAAAGGGTLLSATYTAAFADFASEYTVCYDFRGLGAEAVPFWGVWDWVSAPALVAGDQAFAVTLQGVAGFSMWDEWRLIVKRNGVCETLGTGHAVLPDMLFGRCGGPCGAGQAAGGSGGASVMMRTGVAVAVMGMGWGLRDLVDRGKT
jgi:hypothetical protein